jgi:DNA-binding NarL/FixJ family response regulator
VVDDHPIVRLGIRQLLGAERDLEVCGEAASADEANQFIENSVPDLAIVDLSLGEDNGLDLIRSLHESVPALPVLVMSMHDEALLAEPVLRAGARGYIMKHEAATRLLGAIRQVLSGRIYLSERIAKTVLERQGRNGA